MSFFDGPGAPLGSIVRGPLPDGEVAGVMPGHSADLVGTIASPQRREFTSVGNHLQVTVEDVKGDAIVAPCPTPFFIF